jgi:hypothetical protein
VPRRTLSRYTVAESTPGAAGFRLASATVVNATAAKATPP